jgi:hypothetical protein
MNTLYRSLSRRLVFLVTVITALLDNVFQRRTFLTDVPLFRALGYFTPTSFLWLLSEDNSSPLYNLGTDRTENSASNSHVILGLYPTALMLLGDVAVRTDRRDNNLCYLYNRRYAELFTVPQHSNSSLDKARPACKADNLTAIWEPIVYK